MEDDDEIEDAPKEISFSSRSSSLSELEEVAG
jgi:hypothetical protein